MSTVIDGSAGVTTPSGAVYNGIASGTAVASTSGTSITFTGIPSWVKRITVMFNGVSTTGTSNLQVQIGSGSVTTSGYLGSCYGGANGSSPVSANFTAGFGLTTGSVGTALMYGGIVITNINSNNWVAFGTTGRSDVANTYMTAGSISLSGTLDRVNITTVNGTDTFDAGSINILWE